MAPKKKASKGKAKKRSVTSAPQIIVSKGSPTAAQLLERVLATMDEGNWITKKQGKDFVESLKAVVTDEISSGNPVNLFGLVKISPRLHTAGQREVSKVFGDPDSGKVTKKYKPRVTLKATQAIFGKEIKDSLPSAQKLGKKLGV